MKDTIKFISAMLLVTLGCLVIMPWAFLAFVKYADWVEKFFKF